MKIKHNLLPKQKRRASGRDVNIDAYPYVSSLLEELEKFKIIERLQVIPQLGVIKVSKKLNKSRYDYVLLQLYFHQIIGKRLKKDLSLHMEMRLTQLNFRMNSLMKNMDVKKAIHSRYFTNFGCSSQHRAFL